MISNAILGLVAALEDARGEQWDMQKHECFVLFLDKKTFDAVDHHLKGLMTEGDGELKGLGVTIRLDTDKEQN